MLFCPLISSWLDRKSYLELIKKKQAKQKMYNYSENYLLPRSMDDLLLQLFRLHILLHTCNKIDVRLLVISYTINFL